MANEANDINNQDDNWELSLDIDDFDLRLTPALCLSSSTHIETSHSNQNRVRIIPDPAGIVQHAKLLKEKIFILGSDGALTSTQEYMQKVVEDLGEDDDFKSCPWVSATNYVNTNGDTVTGCLGDIKNFLKNRKLDQVVAIVKSCSPNAISDRTMTMKDLTGTIPRTIHYKVIGEGGYGKDITVFRKDTVPGSGSGVGRSGMLMEKEEIVKLIEEEEMADFKLRVCKNVTDQDMADEEALNLALEEEARQARAEHEWLEKCRQEEELDEEHERQLWGFYDTF
ncbi:ribonuclease H-like domain-containing protein [Tanacetum coccineum]